MSIAKRLPNWLKVPIATGKEYTAMKEQLNQLNLKTICQEGKCPNIGECWSGPAATATIMIMGDTCTRACRFCSVKTSKSPAPLDESEPEKVAAAIASWSNVKHVVLTTVDRDDLLDGGCLHFIKTIKAIKAKAPHLHLEILAGDFGGNLKLVSDLARTNGLSVFGHNIETVERLTPIVRDRRAGYRQSLAVLQMAKQSNPQLLTKSALMMGCGETIDEAKQALLDLRSADVDSVNIGQYMRPTRRNMSVTEYINPFVFNELKDYSQKIGFKYVASGPLVRSSYKAGEYYLDYISKTPK